MKTRQVGHNPDPLSKVRRSDIGSTKHSPSRIKPHLGQVSENSSKSPRSENWRVFHEHESRSYFTNDAGHLNPQAASFSIKPVPVPCAANVLAGESSANDINPSAPRLAVESSHVVPDREDWQQSVALSGKQYPSWVLSKLNSADGAPSKQVPSQDAASCPCK
jgi:hypothetical protein